MWRVVLLSDVHIAVIRRHKLHLVVAWVLILHVNRLLVAMNVRSCLALLFELLLALSLLVRVEAGLVGVLIHCLGLHDRRQLLRALLEEGVVHHSTLLGLGNLIGHGRSMTLELLEVVETCHWRQIKWDLASCLEHVSLRQHQRLRAIHIERVHLRLLDERLLLGGVLADVALLSDVVGEGRRAVVLVLDHHVVVLHLDGHVAAKARVEVLIINRKVHWSDDARDFRHKDLVSNYLLRDFVTLVS